MTSPRLVASPGLQDPARLHAMNMGPRFVRGLAPVSAAAFQGPAPQRLVYSPKPGTSQVWKNQQMFLFDLQWTCFSGHSKKHSLATTTAYTANISTNFSTKSPHVFGAEAEIAATNLSATTAT